MADTGRIEALACALAIGLLIGLERGWLTRMRPDGSRVAGFRTFGLLGLAGGAAGMLPVALAAVTLAAITAMLLIGYARDSADERERSATAALAGVLTLILGTLATSGQPAIALGAAAVVTLILSMRERLHALLKGVTAAEVESIARFSLIALVILPLMPDRAMGPYLALNPRKIWFVVVLVCGLSFLGYAATRRAGATRGLLLTALTGAIVSSTAVSAAYARKLVEPSASEGALIAGIAIASTTMFVRVLVLAALLLTSALPSLALAMAPATIVALALAALSLRNVGAAAEGDVKLGNPLDFGPALLLAAMVAVLAIVSRWAQARYGEAGLGVLLAITGVADVDAAVLTLAGLAPGTVDGRTAGLLLTAPVLANTALKAVMVMVIAPNRRGIRAAAPPLASIAAAGAALAAMH